MHTTCPLHLYSAMHCRKPELQFHPPTLKPESLLPCRISGILWDYRSVVVGGQNYSPLAGPDCHSAYNILAAQNGAMISTSFSLFRGTGVVLREQSTRSYETHSYLPIRDSRYVRPSLHSELKTLNCKSYTRAPNQTLFICATTARIQA